MDEDGREVGEGFGLVLSGDGDWILEPDRYIGRPILSRDIRHFPIYRYRLL